MTDLPTDQARPGPEGEVRRWKDEPVIVIGGGPVGLAAGLELARFGMPSVIIEQRDTTSWHPKTRNVNARTMEIARGWGSVVHERLRAIDTPGWKSPIRFVERAVDEDLGAIETRGFEGPGLEVSPGLPVMSSQDLVESILFDAASASDLIDLRFGTTATEIIAGASDDDRSVVLEIEPNGAGGHRRLEGSALVGADGVDSLVRTQLGIGLEGPQSIAHFVNCYFRADIESVVSDRPAVLYFVANDRARGVLQPLDARGRWLCQIGVRPHDWEPGAYDERRCTDWIRAAVGVDDLDVEVLSVGRWRMNATVAEEFRRGRIVLCGDAAHQFPPTGGLGVNTGIQAMHNVVWKLVYCATGRADWSLLDTYAAERRATARWTADQSLENSNNVARIGRTIMGRGDERMTTAEIVASSHRYGNHFGVELGTRYRSRAVVPDGTEPPPVADPWADYAPSACPGCRAPHLWLGPGRPGAGVVGSPSGGLSSIDLFGPGFTVLSAVGAGWSAAAREARRRLGVPVGHYEIGGPGLEDHAGRFDSLYELGPRGAVVVRPDGYVGWRTRRPPTDGTDLVTPIASILGRS